MKGVLPPLNDERVASVGPSVETRADLHILREDVHKFPLSLVSPLRTEDDAELAHFGVCANSCHQEHRPQQSDLNHSG